MSEQRIALVTGASRGIGAAILTALGEQGHTVIGTATSEAGAESISASLSERGFTGTGVAMNVTDADTVTAALKAIGERFGAPVILVNNAGITRDQLLMRMSDDDWDAVIETNLKGVFRLTKACLRPMMKARFGRIISITSVIGQMGNAGQANYAAAKAGIIGFTRSIAREVGSRGITVNAVAPGFIDTDMTRALDESARDALLGQVALGRLGAPKDIAAAVAYLASEGAGYVTGETLSVNGGLYMS
ncbi:MAG: 3-oxoacyl-ACP reductase FabG [Pseudomonadota bacterium]